MRLRWLWIVPSLALIALVWGGWSWLGERRDRNELMEADREMADGLHQLAPARFVSLTNKRSGWDQANYRLGLCEEILGHFDAAQAALSRIPSKSSLASQAALVRGRLAMNTGKLASARALLLTILREQGPSAEQARTALQLLYHIQGRTSEIRELIDQSWRSSSDAGGLLRKIYLLDHSAFPVDRVRKTLENADATDDRVWLGKANLAAWTGQYEHASRLLDQCTERRPNDEPVWRARLELARSTGDLTAFKLAGSHLSLGRFTRAEVADLRAWAAARQGNVDVEKSALAALTSEEPGNIAAWDRLAELALSAGKKEEAEYYRKQKAAFNELRKQYKKLLDRDDRAKHANALANLADRLGRRIEARGWKLIAQGRASSEPLVIADDLGVRGSSTTNSLDSALGDLLTFAESRTPAQKTGKNALAQVSVTRPRRLVFVSSMTTATLNATRRHPRRCVAASRSLTTTAMAGSTCMSCKEAHFPHRIGIEPGRPFVSQPPRRIV